MNEPDLDVRVTEKQVEVSGCLTDTFSIDHYTKVGNKYSSSHTKCDAHTVILFIPGNPGAAGWYINMLKEVVEKLGKGYAARAVSYAGHGVCPIVVGSGIDKSHIAWTVDGQIQHKIDWIEIMEQEFNTSMPKFIWISHSIGSFMVQRMLVLRKDFLIRTRSVIHLMPFFRYDPYPKWKEKFLSFVARSPTMTTFILHHASSFAQKLPKRLVDVYLEHIAGVSIVEDRELARGLMCNPAYAKNFITLGMEEIRDLPEQFDVAALRIISEHSPTHIFYCGGPDQWAPLNHYQELESKVKSGLLPKNIRTAYNDDLLHAFIVNPIMIPPVVDFILESIEASPDNMERKIRAKL